MITVLDNCPICLEEISQINRTITPCGHTFHSSCIFKHIIAAHSCPTMMSLICPLCRKIAFNSHEDGCQYGCCRPDLMGVRSPEDESDYDFEDDYEDHSIDFRSNEDDHENDSEHIRQ